MAGHDRRLEVGGPLESPEFAYSYCPCGWYTLIAAEDIERASVISKKRFLDHLQVTAHERTLAVSSSFQGSLG